MNRTPLATATRRVRPGQRIAVAVGAAQVSATTDRLRRRPRRLSRQRPTAPTTAAPTTAARRRRHDDHPAPRPPVQPLTGLPIDGDARHLHPRPAMVVKIDNVEAEPAVRSEPGRHRVRGDRRGRVTRFAAVFKCRTPTRSARSARVAPRTSTSGRAERSALRVVGRQRRRDERICRRPVMTSARPEALRACYRDNTAARVAAQPVRQHQRAARRTPASRPREPIFEYTAMGAESRRRPLVARRRRSDRTASACDWDYDAAAGPVPALPARATPTRPRPAR